jgi:hypothetical protein
MSLELKLGREREATRLGKMILGLTCTCFEEKVRRLSL